MRGYTDKSGTIINKGIVSDLKARTDIVRKSGRFAIKFCLAMLILSAAVSFVQNAHADENGNSIDSYLNSLFPLKPQYIARVRDKVESQEAAAQIKPGAGNDLGKPQIFQVSTNPVSEFTHPVVNIGLNMITSLVITDQRGKIWPVDAFTIGNNTDFKVTWPNNKGGVLLIQGLKPYKETNIALMLRGVDVPVMVTLLTGQKKWSDINYLRVFNNASTDDNTEAAENIPQYLVDLLANIAPDDAKPLAISGASSSTKIWSYHGNYIMRTPDTLLSPQWRFHTENDGGAKKVNVYEIPPASHVLLNNTGGIYTVIAGENNA